MTKQTKTLLGLAVIAGVGYYAYTQFKPKSMVGFIAPNCQKNPKQCPCTGENGGCPNKVDEGTMKNGQSYEICKNGHICFPKGTKSQLEFVG